MDTPSRHLKEVVWAQILYIFIIPTLLLYFGVIPEHYRVVLLAIVGFLMLGIIRHNKWTHADIAIMPDWMKDIVPYTLFTIGGIGFLVWLSFVVPHAPLLDWWENKQFLLLFIPISVLQEVIFRGFLMNLLRRAFSSPIFIIALNATLFALLHVIYLNSTFVLPLAFIAGIGFAWMYYQYPNLILISLAHTVLNFTAMILGFFIIR
jgi:membrane protease YdiL (CAAX protease family)